LGGDAARAWTLAQRTAEGGGALASVAVDRLLGVVAVVVLGAAGTVAWIRQEPGSAPGWGVVAGTAIVAGAVVVFWADRLFGLVIPAARRTGWIASVGRLADAVGAYRRVPRTLATVLALSIVVQAMRVLQAATLAHGLALPVPLGYFFVFMPVGLLLLQLPVSVGGFGAPQGVIVWLLERRGLPQSDGFALSTLIVLLGIAGSLPGAWLHFRSRRR
jgi:hypothetical protein